MTTQHVQPLPVSVIVPLFNAEDTVIETLDSIANQSAFNPLEILVVDDGSSDNSATLVQHWIQNLTPHPDAVKAVLIRQVHGGEASAINTGLKHARHSLVAWVESDVKLHPDWLVHLLPELDEERVMGAGGLLLPAENDPAVAKIFGYEIAYKMAYKTSSSPDEVRHITSASALYKKTVFDQLGWCRVDLGESSFDSEFNYRIREAGYILRCNSQALAWHHFKSNLFECLRRTWWYGFRRPFVKSQVLYPFDKIIALTILFTGLLFPGVLLAVISPPLSLVFIGCSLLTPIGYSLFLYCHFHQSALLWSPLVFYVRNILFLIAYAFGWMYKWIRPKTETG